MSERHSERTAWDIQRSRETYNVLHWGAGYFDINARGHLVALAGGTAGPAIDLHQLAQEIQGQGLSLPVLVRFTDILRDRVDVLLSAFDRAMAREAYCGGYAAVYPIKVNQQRSVVQEIVSHGGVRVGLEAGSKPELLAALAHVDPVAGIVVCNGYKDREYVRLALRGRQLGYRLHLVVEKLSELDLVLAAARALGVRPSLGLRVRLASIGAGKWQNTGGEQSKFGLSSLQVLAAVQRLAAAGMLDTLRLLHFHVGSQVANIRDIQRALREGARYYAELRRLGAPIAYVDVGGGLGVDYEGTRSRSHCSMNYGVEEYANNVVHALTEICAEAGLPHPTIITEAGRAMTAHHAVLLTNVIDSEPGLGAGEPAPPGADEPPIIHDLWRGYAELSGRAAIEAYHDAGHWLAEAQVMFTHGVLSLDQRAHAEALYAAILRQVAGQLDPGARPHREARDELLEKLADKYFCNFSLFQSIPDAWAIQQVFPIVPLQRLQERPQRRAVLQDLTCDSDGRIDYYVDSEGVETTLPLHDYDRNTPYLLGIFLVGAYQEILGDMHNLFGDTHSLHVELSGSSYKITQPLYGDRVEAVLRLAHFEPRQLLQTFATRIAAADLEADIAAAAYAELEAGLKGYTYLED